MTRRIMYPALASLLAGMCLSSIGCGGSKPPETSNAPVGKPAEGQPAPVQAGSAVSDGGTPKMSEEGATVPRK